MKKKVFASDFDGTLYFYKAEDKLPAANVEAIRRYQAAGCLFGLCTGRQVGGLTPFITGLVRPDFYITSSGANIVDGDMKVEGDICVFAKMDYPGKYYVITGVDDAPQGLIHQVSVHTESLDDAARLSAEINRRFGDRIEAFQNVIEIDIAPKGCSKGKGVEALREHMREAYGDITLYGIGDSINDLPLLRAADVSYTFPYAPDICRQTADKVVPTIVDALEDSLRDSR